jgi:hypothetical protein
LSAYNGEAFQLNIVDLCTLDKEHYQAALSVIRGRNELGTEPQSLLDNSDQIFKGLWEQWQRYHVENRAKPTCNLCYGSGLIPEYPDDGNNYSQTTCTQCEGKGQLIQFGKWRTDVLTIDKSLIVDYCKSIYRHTGGVIW